ncbi:alkane 1-monooxygenase [Pseudooceanicola antarcticus]|uniref:Alkane 1-monooxygenase n=1 Tax=Pseudooceanicola antarcticus TaxID=1247613 RepID=A0A285IWC0_9RHOB|nr:alkane 1-monooxygenase [Pseudooceanicola antarcticus]PJE32051.1 alkane 1-monooxygenase [Pseudooceanicola antarcticus]SNY51396.1 alkane 1-monooxygenase [Pseudooceanicola antarcticus]
MPAFLIATLVPVPLLLLAALAGGGWGWVALVYLTGFTALLDALLPKNWQNQPLDQPFIAGAGLQVSLGLAHLWLVLVAMRFLGGPGGAETWSEVLPAALAFGVYFGQVSHPDAHELIHRPSRDLRRLGRMIYATMLFGHHASAHPKIHHVWVASPQDPNTARLGEGFWRYLPRAWRGSFLQGFRVESQDLKRAGRTWLRHPYLGYLLTAALCLGLAAAFGGLSGLAIYVGICAFAQVQILLSDYVQHYGLQREELAHGKLAPVGPQHSWNAPHAASQAMMLNAPRHSDHHLHPGRIYPGLQLDAGRMPMLPRSLPVMATVALFPGWWRRVMDPRVRAQQASPPGTARQ